MVTNNPTPVPQERQCPNCESIRIVEIPREGELRRWQCVECRHIWEMGTPDPTPQELSPEAIAREWYHANVDELDGYPIPELASLISAAEQRGAERAYEKAAQVAMDTPCSHTWRAMIARNIRNKAIRELSTPEAVRKGEPSATVNHACHICGKPVEMATMTVCVACADAH